MHKFIFTVLFLAVCFTIYSQTEQKYQVKENSPEWVKLMYANNPDVGKTVAAYNQYYKSNELIKNKYTQYYKRWLRAFSRSTLPLTKDVLTQQKAHQNNAHFIQKSLKLKNDKAPTSPWQCIGPWDFDKEAASRSYAPGAAHVYTIERAASDSLVFYAGTATAGLWKSIDGGQNWTLLTQNLILNRVFALEIDHSNSDIVYFESNGSVYKTTDGGVIWNIIGDAAFTTQSHQVKDIVMDPANTNILYLTSDNGFYRTVDGGNNWTPVLSGEFQEIEIHPTNSNIIYTIEQTANKTQFYKSIDGGVSFVLKLNGWPSPLAADEQKRTEIAVTPAAPNMIYALATGEANGGSGLYGIYVSSDEGESWTFRCCGPQPAGPPSLTNPNFMAWSKDGTDDGGQYYYDVALAVDPVDSNKIHVGGVNRWVSTDGGYNFNCPAKWSEPNELNYVHADIHDIRYFGNDLWIACDGGIFKSTDGGTNINKTMLGIAGTDFWGFGASHQSNVMLGGAYHNGTLLKDNNTYINDWICTGGGDGVRGFVNYGNDRIAYDDYEGRILSGDRTVAIGSFNFDSLPNSSYIIGASSRFAFDPRNYNTIYFGRYNTLLKTPNNGQTYEVIHDFGAEVMAVEIAWSNPDVMYVVTYESWWGAKKIWKTVDAGASWSEITPPTSLLNGNLWVPFDIAVSSNDANILWAARTSQYNGSPVLDGNQVFKTIDGGLNWSNVTTSTLDGEYITNIIHQRGTDGGVYLGTRRAVYYRNNTLSDWELFNNNLPLSTPSTKLVPYYKDRKLRNATSRSVYEVEFYENSTPQAQISSDKNVVACYDSIVHFVDYSVLSNDNPIWQWSFPGGTPSTSSQQNPIVSYSTPGTYDVSLIVSDNYGIDSISYSAFINYSNTITSLNLIENFDNGISLDWRLFNAAQTYAWSSIDILNGPDCVPTKCAIVEHYSIDQVADEAELITPTLDLTGVVNPNLIYDYAYARYNSTYSDGFRIDISNNCGLSWDTLFQADGSALATVGDQGNWWEPTNCTDWSVNNMISLSAYIGDQVMIRFVAINGYGNNFYLDNINIVDGSATVNEIANEMLLNIFPNPSKGELNIKHNSENGYLEIFSLDGKRVFDSHLKKSFVTINSLLSPGIYMVKLSESSKTIIKKVIITN